MFFGIVLYMYYDDHAPAHFHALYEGSEAIFQIDGELIKGRISQRAARLIKEWASLHRVELDENWHRACHDLPLNWIEPLR
jgi:hypothetical protein